jgi:hypothetical protein
MSASINKVKERFRIQPNRYVHNEKRVTRRLNIRCVASLTLQPPHKARGLFCKGIDPI